MRSGSAASVSRRSCEAPDEAPDAAPANDADDAARGEYPAARPRTRGECHAMPRPCPFVSCRHHLALDVDAATGAVRLNFPGQELDDLAETCALDVADRGGATLAATGALVNLSRARVFQLESRVLQRFRAAALDALDGA